MDLFENQISEPPNLDGTSFLQNFKSDPSNIKICQDYLKDESCSEKLQIILSSVLWDFVKNVDEIQILMKMDLEFSISDWCINILFQNFQFLSKPTIRTISMIFGYIVYNLWSVVMDGKFQSIFKDQSDDQSNLFLNQFCQLNIMNETILIFSQEYKLCLKNKDQPRLNFSRRLHDLYELAEIYIQHTDDQDIINIGLQVIFNCLCFGEISYFDKYVGSLKHALTPQQSIESILSQDSINFLMQTYIKTHENYALQSLCCILKMPNSSFTNLQDIIDVFTDNLPEILSLFLDIENPAIIYLIDLIYSYSATLKENFIFDGDLKEHFVEITRIIYEFSISFFNPDNFLRENLKMYSNLMKFWAKLSNIFIPKFDNSTKCYIKEYPEQLTLLLEKINEITKRYLFTLLQLILTDDPELIYDVLYDEDDESLASPFQILISSQIIDISQLVFEVFEEYLNDGNPPALSLFIKLSGLMLIKSPSSIYDNVKLKKEKIFDQSLKIIEFSAKQLQTDPKSINVNFEVIIQYFIKDYKKFFDENSTQTIIALIYRAIISLQVFGHEDMITQAAIEALESILSIKVHDDEYYPDYKKVCDALLENFTEFPFLQEKEIKNKIQKANKTIFIQIIYSISAKYAKLYYIFDFLTGLLNSNDIDNLITSLIAILSISRDKFYFYKENEMQSQIMKLNKVKLSNSKETKIICNWLLPENVLYFIENGKNTSLMNLILKFWQKMLKSDPIFEKHSNFGILIFDAASSTIGSSIEFYLQLVSENNEDDQIRFQLAKRISSCASLLLEKKYIMYDAYIIYNNPNLNNFLNILTNFLQNTDFQYIIDHPKLFSSFCSLIRSIITKQLKYSSIQLFEQIEIFYRNLMNQHLISFSKSNDSKKIFTENFYNFVHYINYSQRDDISDIKSIVHNCFVMAFCFLLEIMINNKPMIIVYNTIIKELIVHDDSLLNLFKVNFEQIVSNPTDFNDLFDKFVADLPNLMSPTAMENDFAKYFEDFIKMKNNDDVFHFAETS